MVDKLLKANIWKNKVFAGVRVFISADSELHFSYALFEKNKKIIKRKEFAPDVSLSNLKETLNSGIPVSLLIDGKGIVHRKIIVDENNDEQSLVNKVLPNANSEQFYTQVYSISNEHAFVSVIRKTQLIELLDQLQELSIVSCSLGPFMVDSLSTYFPETEFSLNVKDAELKYENRQLIEYVKRGDIPYIDIQIGEERVNSADLTAYSAGLNYYYQFFDGLKIDFVQHNNEEFLFKTLIKKYVVGFLALIFTLLMVNFFLFSHYYSKKSELTGMYSADQYQLELIDSLEKDYNYKREFIQQNNMSKNSVLSFYSDDLVKELPAGIMLTDLNMLPLIKSGAAQDTMAFESKVIKISGESEGTIILNDWIKKIKQKNWVSGARIIHINQGKESEKLSFELECSII